MLIAEVLWILLAYVAGSIPFGVIIGRIFCGVDPRSSGSKSSGATNVSRSCGFKYGVLTLACDLAKGALPVWGAFWINHDVEFVSITGLACVVGHVFSCFMKLKGGKAVATSIGVFIPLAFWSILGSCALCMLVIWRTGFVSAGSLSLMASLPIFLMIADKWQWLPLSVCLLIIVFVKHHENIARLRAGTEKAWLKGKSGE